MPQEWRPTGICHSTSFQHLLVMSQAHIFMTLAPTHTHDNKPVAQPIPVTLPKFWPVPSPAHKEGSVYCLPCFMKQEHSCVYFV